MKKLVLVAVWASILTIFLAFNYLLWERENTHDTENVKTPVKDTVDELNAAIKRLEESNVKLQKDVDLLTAYNNQYQEEIRKKNILIYELKKIADLSFLEDIVKLWVKSVNDKDYKTAFRLFSNEMIYQKDYTLRMRDYFKSYKELIKTIKVKSIELDLEHTEKGRNGEIILKVVLDVRHIDPDKCGMYKEGLNTRYFFMTYDDITEEWYIAGIQENI